MKKYYLFGILIAAGIFALAHAAPAPASDIDGDGIVDGYDTYLSNEIQASRIPSNLVYPIRTFTLDTKGKPLDQIDATDTESSLTEYSGTTQLKKWKTKYEKKGHFRSNCEPPMINVSFDKADSDGVPRALFNGISTYAGTTTLEYQKIRMVADCDLLQDYFSYGSTNSFNGNLDVQLQDYITYKVLRMNKVPTIDITAFANLSFVTPDARYDGKQYHYMFLQRDNEKDDQIPFVKQYNLNKSLFEDGEYDKYYPVWNNSGTSDRFSGVTIHDVVSNTDQTLPLDPETSVRFFLLDDLLKIEDRGVLHNEDYGKDLTTGKWKSIPYGFDLGFNDCNIRDPKWSKVANTINGLPPEVRSQYNAIYYQVAREIFGNEESLYKMLLAVDRFPFSVDKQKLKTYFRLAFYKNAKYFTSQEFANDTGQAYIPLSVNLPFTSDVEADAATVSFQQSCTRVYDTLPNTVITIDPNPTLKFFSKFTRIEYDNNNSKEVEYDNLEVRYVVTINASDSDLYLSKQNLFRFKIYNKLGEPVSESVSAGYANPGIIDEPGPYYLIKKGQSTTFSVRALLSIRNDKSDVYHAELTDLWFGRQYGYVAAPANQTNTVSFVKNPPVINSVSPTGAAIGQTVQLTGTGFSLTNNTINFGNGIVPNVISSDETTLSFSVPATLRTGCAFNYPPCPGPWQPTPLGPINISVTNDNGISSTTPFTVILTTVNTTPSLVVQINGGDWPRKSVQVVGWGSTNIPVANKLSIYLQSGDGTLYPLDNSYVGDSPIYTIVPSTIPLGRYKVLIKTTVPGLLGGVVVSAKSDQYVKIIAPVASSKVTVSVLGSPTLTLGYDGQQAESKLTASFTVNVTAGTKDLAVAQQIDWVAFLDLKGNYAVTGSNKTSIEPAPGYTLARGKDVYGQDILIIPAGKSAKLLLSHTVNPQRMLSGSYRATLKGIYNDTNDRNDLYVFLPVSNANMTNIKTILGESSPFIMQAAFVGGKIVVKGLKFGNFPNINLGGNLFKDVIVTKDASKDVLTFKPTGVDAGDYYLYITNPALGESGGKSNTVYLNISKQTPTPSPSVSPRPSGTPTVTATPSGRPTTFPSGTPSAYPSSYPSTYPSNSPSSYPRFSNSTNSRNIVLIIGASIADAFLSLFR